MNKGKIILILGNGFRTDWFNEESISMESLTLKMELWKEIDWNNNYSIKENAYERNRSIIHKIKSDINRIGNTNSTLFHYAMTNYEYFLILLYFCEGINFDYIGIKSPDKIIKIKEKIESTLRNEIKDVDERNLKNSCFEMNILNINKFDEIWTTNYDNSVETVIKNKYCSFTKNINHIHGKMNEDIVVDIIDKMKVEAFIQNENIEKAYIFGMSLSTDWILLDYLANIEGRIRTLEIFAYNKNDINEFQQIKKLISTRGSKIILRTMVTE